MTFPCLKCLIEKSGTKYLAANICLIIVFFYDRDFTPNSNSHNSSKLSVLAILLLKKIDRGECTGSNNLVTHAAIHKSLS